MSPDLEQRFEQLAQLISSVSESLHREMHDGFRQVTERFDLMETRLNRHGALLQTGARWTARMSVWSDQIDRFLSERDKAIADLEQRIRNLEQKRNGHS
jgi:hypothetical protein